MHADKPGDEPATGHRQHREDAARAIDGNQLAIRIEGDLGFDVRVDLSGLGLIARATHRRNFYQAQLRVGIDQARVDVFAAQVDALSVGGNRDVAADRRDLAIAEQKRAPLRQSDR